MLSIFHKKLAVIVLSVMVCFLALANSQAQAATKEEIDADIEVSLERFYTEVPEGRKLVQDAKGVLVFPAVYKAGIGLGGEFGEGALLINGKAADYYNTAAASLGLQLGVQKKTIILVFTQEFALKEFRASTGWKAGVDASIALVKVGAGGSLDTTKLNEPILGFVVGQRGLMYNLTLEGAKFTKIEK